MRMVWWKGLAAVALLGFLVLNLLAYRHAYAMMHVAPAGGAPPPRLDDLTGGDTLKLMLGGFTIPRAVNALTPADVGLPYSQCMLPTADGLRLEGWLIPHDDPRGLVLLFHGYKAAKASLLSEARAYHRMGFSCLLVDFRGGGGSEGDETTLGYREAHDVAATFAFARGLADGQPVLMHGFSMGAAAILRAVVVENVQPDAIVLEAVFDRLLTTTRNRFRLLGVPAFPATPAAELLLAWGSLQCGFNGFRHNPVEYATQVTIPTLVLGGGDDHRATEAQLRAVHAALAGPRQIAIFPGVGHASLLDASPEKWQLVIDAFLASQVNVEVFRRYHD